MRIPALPTVLLYSFCFLSTDPLAADEPHDVEQLTPAEPAAHDYFRSRHHPVQNETLHLSFI